MNSNTPTPDAVEQDIRRQHREDLDKALTGFLTWVPEDKRKTFTHAVVEMIHAEMAAPEDAAAALDEDDEDYTPSPEEALVNELGAEILAMPGINVSEDEYAERMNQLVDESMEEMQLYCRMKGIEGIKEIMGDTGGTGIVLGGGFGMRNADGTWTEGSF